MVFLKNKPATYLKAIPKSIWVLGFVSMLTDISSDMVHSLLPMYLVSTMGASVLTVGLIEGVAESSALMMKVFSGGLSDFLGRRKILAVVGYGLSAITKPIFPTATSIEVILGARFLDRIGKGIRDAPRDALIVDITPPELRGSAFGLRQALDSVGAFLGPSIAVMLMLVWANDFKKVFWVATLPAILAVTLMLLFVKETHKDRSDTPLNLFNINGLKQLGSNYWSIISIGIMLGLARYSDAFLVLRAYQSGIPMFLVPLIMVVMNVVYAAVSYPIGKLSDHVGHGQLIKWGVFTLLLANIVLASGKGAEYVLLGVSLWGLHMGISQGLLASMIANVAPVHLRGTAYGVFNFCLGLSMLASNAMAGLIWDQWGAEYTFYAGAFVCMFCLVLLFLKIIKIPPALIYSKNHQS